MLTTFVPQNDLKDGKRADPGYWHPGYDRIFDTCRRPLRPLGDFITFLTYGPIVTGAAPTPQKQGVTLLNQGQLARTGVDATGATLVEPGSPWDLARARPQPGDILLALSGVASVAKNRVTIFLGDYPAVVGSFVDIIRVSGIDPLYVLAYLKTEYAWAQIHHIINGVGTPNISFPEIRDLRIAVLTDAEQQAVRMQYLDSVHAEHLAALAARRQGRAALAAKRFATAWARFEGIIHTVEAAIWY